MMLIAAINSVLNAVKLYPDPTWDSTLVTGTCDNKHMTFASIKFAGTHLIEYPRHRCLGDKKVCTSFGSCQPVSEQMSKHTRWHRRFITDTLHLAAIHTSQSGPESLTARPQTCATLRRSP